MALSPDPSTIEDLWSELGKRVHNRRLKALDVLGPYSIQEWARVAELCSNLVFNCNEDLSS